MQLDAFRIQQVLRNVIANALRFSPDGGVIRLVLSSQAQTVQLTVSDQGPGIPEDEREHIFEPFVQSSRTKDGSGGTGLGLTICRRIMQAHGGWIQAANNPQGGALITLAWPLNSAAAG
ncbi:sensor histidine kinase [Ideonella paludis]